MDKTKLKLASLWTSLMFVNIYVDYFHLYMPDQIQQMMNGKVYIFDITQGFILIALLLMTLPSVMIFLSIILKVKANRVANISLAAIFIPVTLFNLGGETWIHMIFGALVAVMYDYILCLEVAAK
jgi:hypothetical protein